MIPFKRKEKIISILQKNNLMLLNDIQKVYQTFLFQPSDVMLKSWRKKVL